MMEGFIYLFRNRINDKCNVGKTIDIDRRYHEHIYGKTDSAIHRALIKYGVENFDFLILEKIVCEDISELNEKLNKLEKQYIENYKSYGSGYNLTTGGDGTPGVTRSEYTRELMSRSKIGDNNPMKNEEVKLRMIESLKEYYRVHGSKPLSEEARKKISLANSGENNGMYGRYGELNPSFGRDWTKYIDEDKLNKFRKRRSECTTGEKNPMYGKSAMKGKKYPKLAWIDEDGNLQYMCLPHKKRYHPNWKLYEEHNEPQNQENTQS